MASHGNGSSRYVPGGSCTLPTVNDMIPTEMSRYYHNDGLLENWQGWEEPLPTKSEKPSLTSLSKKLMLPTMVDRAITENAGRSVAHSPTRGYVGRSGGRSPRPRRFLAEFPPSLSNHAYEWGNSRAYMSRVADKMPTRSTLVRFRGRPYWLLPTDDATTKSPARLYLDNSDDPSVMRRRRDPLICPCCEDINKINLYNQRLGRFTRYPLLPTLPRLNIMARERREGRKKTDDIRDQCCTLKRQDSNSDIYNTGF